MTHTDENINIAIEERDEHIRRLKADKERLMVDLAEQVNENELHAQTLDIAQTDARMAEQELVNTRAILKDGAVAQADEIGRLNDVVQTIGEELLVLEDYGLARDDIMVVIDTLNEACRKHGAPKIPYPGKVEAIEVSINICLTFDECFVTNSVCGDLDLLGAVQEENPSLFTDLANALTRAFPGSCPSTVFDSAQVI